MRISNLIYLILSVAFFSACASDDLSNGAAQPAFADGGYVRMTLRTTFATGGRGPSAVSSYPDGAVGEYAMRDAILVLFQGDDEPSARFHSAYPVYLTPQMSSEEQVTWTSKVVKRLPNNNGMALTGSKLYALVVVNGNGLFKISEDHVTLVVNHEHTLQSVGGAPPMTFADFQKIVIKGGADKLHSDRGGFLMLNAPLCHHAGGSVTTGAGLTASTPVTTLVEVTPHVCRTEAEANAKPATEVFVERAVAKVTMEQKSGALKSSNIILDDGSPDYLTKKIPWKVLDWRLDVLHHNSYLVRVYDPKWNALHTQSPSTQSPYRFVGNTPLMPGLELYRTYWCYDPNYSSYRTSDFTYLSGTFDTRPAAQAFGDARPQYCMENSFDIDNQRQDRSTRAVVKVQIGDGADLYTADNDKTKMYSWTQMDKRIKKALINNTTTLRDSFRYAFSKWEGGTLTECPELTPDYFTYDYVCDPSTGIFTITSVTLYNNKNKTVNEATDDACIVLNNAPAATPALVWNDELGLTPIKKYTNGITYYPLRIKHFGDDFTPWNDDADIGAITPKPSTGQIYPSADTNREGNYLGRYGVVRNNWYNLEVSSISGLGEPDIPQTDTDFNDEMFHYISVSVKVLPWKRRDQGAEF